MALHRLNAVTIGVPDVNTVLSNYQEFGLTREAGDWPSTRDSGRQLRIVQAPRRRLVSALTDEDDVGRIARNLDDIGVRSMTDGRRIVAVEPATGVLDGTRVSFDRVASQKHHCSRQHRHLV